MNDSTTAINPALADDLRFTYLHAFDSFATNPGDLVDATRGTSNVNQRYARELLGILVNAGVLTIEDVNGEEDVWQVAKPGTYDEITREAAVDFIDQWLAEHGGKTVVKSIEKAIKAESKAKAKSGAWTSNGEAINCLCGCGVQVGGKSRYRPGHDARHAGNVARTLAKQILAGEYKTVGDASIDPMDGIDSERLRGKVLAIAEGIVDKASKSSTKATTRWVDADPIKKGRWTYPARRLEGGPASGQVQRNTARDGSGEWVNV